MHSISRYNIAFTISMSPALGFVLNGTLFSYQHLMQYISDWKVSVLVLLFFLSNSFSAIIISIVDIRTFRARPQSGPSEHSTERAEKGYEILARKKQVLYEKPNFLVKLSINLLFIMKILKKFLGGGLCPRIPLNWADS